MKNLLEKKIQGYHKCLQTRPEGKEGISAFWRGNLAKVIRYFPVYGLFFGFRDPYRKNLTIFNIKSEFMRNLAFNAAASVTSLIFAYPLDFARTRLAAAVGKGKNQRQFIGLVDCINKIYNSDRSEDSTEVLGFLWWECSFTDSLSFLLFHFEELHPRSDYSEDLNYKFMKFGWTLMTGGIAGLYSYPFDTVRRRLMMQSGRKEVLYTGTVDCFVKIAKYEGFQGFFKSGFSNIICGSCGYLVLALCDEYQLPKPSVIDK